MAAADTSKIEPIPANGSQFGRIACAVLFSAFSLSMLWFGTRSFVLRDLHNASHFGLGSFGWLIASGQMVVGVITGLVAIRVVLTSVRFGLWLCMLSNWGFYAGWQVVSWAPGVTGEKRLTGYWLFTLAWLVMSIAVAFAAREEAMKRREGAP